MTDFILDLFTPNGFMGIVKFFIVIFEILFVVFAFITVRQVKLMNSSFNTKLSGFFTFLSYILFFASIALVAISILIL